VDSAGGTQKKSAGEKVSDIIKHSKAGQGVLSEGLLWGDEKSVDLRGNKGGVRKKKRVGRNQKSGGKFAWRGRHRSDVLSSGEAGP